MKTFHHIDIWGLQPGEKNPFALFESTEEVVRKLREADQSRPWVQRLRARFDPEPKPKKK